MPAVHFMVLLTGKIRVQRTYCSTHGYISVVPRYFIPLGTRSKTSTWYNKRQPKRAKSVDRNDRKLQVQYYCTCGSSGSGEHISAWRDSKAVLMVRAGDHWSFNISCRRQTYRETERQMTERERDRDRDSEREREIEV